MAENNFWFKFKFKDWAGDVKPLSLAARGLLIELIIYLRTQDGEMPVDFRLISRISGGLTEEVTEIFSEFRAADIFDFENRGSTEFLISRKIKKEFAKSLTNSSNGKLGGNPALNSDNRKNENSDNRKDNPNTVSVSNSDFNSFSEKGGMGEKTFPENPNHIENLWHELLAAYPESIAKNAPAGKRAYLDAVLQENVKPEDLIEKAKNYAIATADRPPDKRKTLANWLREREYMVDWYQEAQNKLNAAGSPAAPKNGHAKNVDWSDEAIMKNLEIIKKQKSND